MGHKLALILVGYAASEEPGMAYLVEWLRARCPRLPITHVPLAPEEKPARLRLLSAQVQAGGLVWLRYRAYSFSVRA